MHYYDDNTCLLRFFSVSTEQDILKLNEEKNDSYHHLQPKLTEVKEEIKANTELIEEKRKVYNFSFLNKLIPIITFLLLRLKTC